MGRAANTNDGKENAMWRFYSVSEFATEIMHGRMTEKAIRRHCIHGTLPFGYVAEKVGRAWLIFRPTEE